MSKEEAINSFIELGDKVIEQEEEIERLNNIINEFEEELKWQRKVCLSLNEKFTISRIDTLIDKLQELKGDGSNERKSNSNQKF